MRKDKMERNEKRCGWNKQEKEVRVDKEERKEKKWKKREGKANKGEREESDRERERETKREIFPAFRRSESKSRSTHRRLCVGTKI